MSKSCLVGTLLLMSACLLAQSHLALVKEGRHWSGSEKTEATEAYEPFLVVNGMMFVQARIGEKYASFILDTGAPGIVLNTVKGGKTLRGSGISGETGVRQIAVSDFEFGGRTQTEISAYALDMSRLENATGRKVEGLLGHSFFEGAELEFDFLKNMLHIRYRSEKREKPLLEIPFEMASHLPVITVKVNGKTLRFGLDTGAEVNILNSQLSERLDISTENAQPMTLFGLDRKAKNAHLATLPALQIKGRSFEGLPIVLTDISDLTTASGLKFDGLLGYPFFKDLHFSIDYAKRKLLIWEVRR